MFRIEKAFARANIPKTIRFTEELDAKLTKLANGEMGSIFPLMSWFYVAVSTHWMNMMAI